MSAVSAWMASADGDGVNSEDELLHADGMTQLTFERAVARNTDPDTSHEAAASISGERLRHSQFLVLRALQEMGPQTDEALYDGSSAVRHAMSVSGARTRRRELVDLGRVVDTGERRVLESGRRAIVWAAK